MKKSSLLAISLLTPFLSASTTNSSQHTSNILECSNLPHENATKNLSFNDLPLDIKALVIQHVPLSYLLVCREWEEMTRERRAVELKVFLERAKRFEAEFDSDRVNYIVGYIERHFNTPGGMYRVLSRIIASSYSKMMESASIVGNFVGPNSAEGFMSQNNEIFLKRNRLINKFANFLSNLENPGNILFDLLSGKGNFCEIPLRIRQFIAKRVWYFGIPRHYYQLSSFLSSFHDSFDMFKDSLVEIHPETMASACAGISLGINCTMLSADNQMRLLDSIKLVFSNNSLVQAACLFCKELSPDSSISQIITLMKSCPSISGIAFNVLQSSPEHATAMWCMKELGELDIQLILFDTFKYLLFNNAFLKRHQLLGKWPELLKECNVDNLLCKLPPDLTGLDTQALVKWVNEDFERKGTLSLDSLVILYSLDDDDDALSRYSKSLQKCEEKLKDFLYFSSIALGTGCGRYLIDDKKVALLQLLYPVESKNVTDYLKGDRKTLILQVTSLFKDGDYVRFVRDHLPESDFALLVEACLQSLKTCNVPPLYSRESKLAVQVLLKYIGNDIEKAAGLQHISEYYRAMTFLLSDHDEIADSLIKSEWFKRLNWDFYFSEIRSDWNAMRAAKRIYRLRNPQQHQ